MPIAFEVLPDLNLCLAKFRGEVSTEEHIASFLEYTRHPLFDGKQHALVDMKDCLLENTYFDDMQRLAYQLKDYYEARDLSSRTSVYAPGDVVFGMSRMFQSIADGNSPWEMDVFRTRKEAMAYLDIAPGSETETRLLAVWGG